MSMYEGKETSRTKDNPMREQKRTAIANLKNALIRAYDVDAITKEEFDFLWTSLFLIDRIKE